MRRRKMTLLEVSEKYITEYAADLRAPNYYTYAVRHWDRMLPGFDVRKITLDTFSEYRRRSLDDGASPYSIERRITRFMTLLKYAFDVLGVIDRVPPKGRRLKTPRKPPKVPTIAEVSELYRHCDAAHWPIEIHLTPGEFFRGFLAVAFFTGLRFSDIVVGLKWEHIQPTGIFFQAAKTEKLHVFPIHPVLANHLDRLRGPTERLFPIGKCEKQFRRELKRIAKAAKVRNILPQQMRQIAFNAYEVAQPGAGQLLLGHSLGTSDFYAAKVPELLLTASNALTVPAAFTDEPEPLATTAPLYCPQSLGPEWEFEPGRFGFRGRFHPLRAESHRVLKLMIEKGRPCTFREIAAEAYRGSMPKSEHLQRRRAIAATCRLRHELRKCLGISKAYHVVVTVDRGAEPAWTIHLPDSAIREADAAAAAHRIRTRAAG